MSRINRVLSLQVGSEAADLRFARLACFVAGPVVLVLSVLAVARFAATPSEVLLGVLGSSIVALLLVVFRTVLPIALRSKGDVMKGRGKLA